MNAIIQAVYLYAPTGLKIKRIIIITFKSPKYD